MNRVFLVSALALLFAASQATALEMYKYNDLGCNDFLQRFHLPEDWCLADKTHGRSTIFTCPYNNVVNITSYNGTQRCQGTSPTIGLVQSGYCVTYEGNSYKMVCGDKSGAGVAASTQKEVLPDDDTLHRLVQGARATTSAVVAPSTAGSVTGKLCTDSACTQDCKTQTLATGQCISQDGSTSAILTCESTEVAIQVFLQSTTCQGANMNMSMPLNTCQQQPNGYTELSCTAGVGASGFVVGPRALFLDSIRAQLNLAA